MINPQSNTTYIFFCGYMWVVYMKGVCCIRVWMLKLSLCVVLWSADNKHQTVINKKESMMCNFMKPLHLHKTVMFQVTNHISCCWNEIHICILHNETLCPKCSNASSLITLVLRHYSCQSIRNTSDVFTTPSHFIWNIKQWRTQSMIIG